MRHFVCRQPLFFVAATAVVGVLVDTALGEIPRVKTLWIVLAAIGIAIILCRHSTTRHPSWRHWATVLVVFPLFALLHRTSEESYHRATILNVARAIGRPSIIEGTVDRPVLLRRHPLADHPGRRESSPWQTLIEISVQRLQVRRRLEPCDGRLLLLVDGKCDQLRPGDDLRVYGEIRQLPVPSNPGERDLRDVYRIRHLHARVDVDSESQVVVLDRRFAGPNLLARITASMAARGRELLLRYTGDDAGPLAVALVIGQRDFVDHKTRDLLLVTGTAHLLSVSGLHLAIVVLLAHWTAVLLRMPMIIKVFWVVAICCLYTAITGARPPVLRASVLVGTFMFALWMKRPSQPINTLSLAALILLAWNPHLVFGVGVQLSFLAVGTLIFAGQRAGVFTDSATAQARQQEQRLDQLVEENRSSPARLARRAMRVVVRVTWFSSCVTAISAPLVWYHFHVVSPISILANVVLGPFLFCSLASGVVTVLFGCVFEPLAIIPGFLCEISLRCMRSIISGAAAVSLGHHWLPAPPVWWVAIFYVVISLTLCWRETPKVSCIRYGWIAGWFLIALMLATAKAPLDEGDLEATFVDVGHGTSVVIRFSRDDVWLYDCGRLGNDTGSSRDVDSTLWSLGVTRLRGIVLSHADADHFNALPGLLDRFEVDQIVTAPDMLDKDESALVVIRRAIQEHNVVVREIAEGSTLDAGGHTIAVLHPPWSGTGGSDNANSLVLQIECGGKPLVLPGDLESPGTDFLLQHDRPPPGGVLMAPHHGSLSMDATSVLQWARPRETVVSGGQRARRPEVRRMLSATGSGVHVTNQVGAVRVKIESSGRVEIRSWSNDPWRD